MKSYLDNGSRRLKYRVLPAFLGMGIILSLGFQNCSGPNLAFKEVAQESDNSGLGGEVIPPAVVVNIPVVCDPLAAGQGTCAADVQKKNGLLGNIYSYPNGVGVNSYIERGKKLDLLIQMSHLDIPLRSWTEGFAGPNGPLRDENGEVLNEFFALDLTGFLTLKAPFTSGEYQFALASDDGAILDLNGQTIIDNDGTHSVRWECSRNVIRLTENQSLPMRLRYYQGPRTEIALQVLIRPWSKSNLPCSRNGEWESIPSSFLSH